jgi:gamma-glutamylcyclotransferase (GGCT)/AIG2-like uncharacterized protein YtfP
MDHAADALAMTDIYEGFGNDQPQPNEFTRVLAEAETDSGIVDCWIYLYNFDADESKLIVGGRYHKQ